jgi:Cdc6-like AAA superfamily ATPase
MFTDISGVPGIGKTASVLEVIKNPALGKFKYIYVNGMNYTNPENIYCHILRDLGLMTKVSKTTACLLLSKIRWH